MCRHQEDPSLSRSPGGIRRGWPQRKQQACPCQASRRQQHLLTERRRQADPAAGGSRVISQGIPREAANSPSAGLTTRSPGGAAPEPCLGTSPRGSDPAGDLPRRKGLPQGSPDSRTIPKGCDPAGIPPELPRAGSSRGAAPPDPRSRAAARRHPPSADPSPGGSHADPRVGGSGGGGQSRDPAGIQREWPERIPLRGRIPGPGGDGVGFYRQWIPADRGGGVG